MKSKTLFFTLLIVVGVTANAQDTVRKNSKNILSFSFSRDFEFYELHPEYSGHNSPPTYIYQKTFYIKDRDFSYTLNFNYQYAISNWFSIRSGIGFNRQKTYIGEYDYVEMPDTTIRCSIWDYYTSHFSIPVGVHFSLPNRFNFRPFVSIQLLNTFVFYEKATSRTMVSHYIVAKSNKWRYYNLKPQISIGCDFFVKKKFLLGFEITDRERPIWQNDNMVVKHVKYSNLCFGGQFGYSF